MPMSAPRLLSAVLAGILAVFLAAGVTVVPTAAEAKTIQQLEDERARNAREREAVESALEGTDKELSELYLKLDQTRRDLSEAQTELAIRNEELAAAERQLESVRDRLDVARAQQAELVEEMAADAKEIERASAAIGDVARSAYRGSGNISALAVVMNAGSLQEFADSYSVMNSALRNQNLLLSDLRGEHAVNENRQARLDAVEERITELEEEAEELVAEAEDARAAAANLVDRIARLQADQETQAAELEDVISKGKERLSELKDDDAKIAADIQKIYEQERKAKEERERKAKEERERKAREHAKQQQPKSSSGSTSSGKAPPASSGGSSRTGALIPPITRSLYVTSSYGYRVYPITGGWFMHKGVDLRSGCGEKQIASAGGTVSAVRGAYGNGTHGNQVMINHGMIDGANYVTVYNHLSRFAVSKGQRVSQGQTIGYTGATGMVTGCHVHFEVWRNGRTIDPMSLPAFR